MFRRVFVRGHFTGDEGGMSGGGESGGPVGQSMSAFGKMEPFNPDKGSIAVYLERMELYLSANCMPETKQVPVFLNLIGGDTYELFRNLLAPDKPAETSLVSPYTNTSNPKRW